MALRSDVSSIRGANREARKLFPACRHLGGMVRWNAAERSWDCPVHGARYDADGRALNGPAAADLLPSRD